MALDWNLDFTHITINDTGHRNTVKGWNSINAGVQGRYCETQCPSQAKASGTDLWTASRSQMPVDVRIRRFCLFSQRWLCFNFCIILSTQFFKRFIQFIVLKAYFHSLNSVDEWWQTYELWSDMYFVDVINFFKIYFTFILWTFSNEKRLGLWEYRPLECLANN